MKRGFRFSIWSMERHTQHGFGESVRFCIGVLIAFGSIRMLRVLLVLQPCWTRGLHGQCVEARCGMIPAHLCLLLRACLYRGVSSSCCALSCCQGASAHVSISRDDHVVAHGIASVEHSQIIAGEAARCADMHCAHGHGLCCTTMCGVHCGALFVALRFEPWTPAATLPLPLADPHRVGISYAPLLRPPIA